MKYSGIRSKTTMSLSSLLTATVLCGILACLPSSAFCNTSYYERYYSARRYQPLKKNSLLQFNFTVHLDNADNLAGFERLALVGDLKEFGSWQADKAILFNRTLEHNVWLGQIHLPINTTASYRYFVAAVDNTTNGVQVRRWESNIETRHFTIGTIGTNRSDIFGRIHGPTGDREMQRGWLHSGYIVHFKLFRNPLKINDVRSNGERLRVKIQPIEPSTLTPILPSTRAHTEYVRMQYGNSFLRDQPEYGVPYERNDIVIYHTTVHDLATVAYVVKVYSALDGSDLVRLIGYQYVYPPALIGSEGTLSVNLISPIWLYTIGSLELKYLIIQPLPNQALVDFRTSFSTYWRLNWTNLDVGHRGLGKSLKQSTIAPAFAENTLASINNAGQLGADMVEFDVQLTSDLVPIVYHDYVIYVCMDPKKPKTREDLTEVHIKDVTYEQLKNLKTYHMIGNKIVEHDAHNILLAEDQRLFPSFEDFLTKVNRSLGFDIEIKWPQQLRNGDIFESSQTIDKNTYVDRILEVMLQHGCGRMSFFSSFDADICTLLRFKQNMYPVYFLSSSEMGIFADPRSDTIVNTINNAQAFDLAGIIPNEVPLKDNPDMISQAMRQQKKVFVWGSKLIASSIEYFKQLGATGVIYDRLDMWLRKEHKNSTFAMETDLPAFFQRQCSPTQLQMTTAGNATTESSLSNVNFL